MGCIFLLDTSFFIHRAFYTVSKLKTTYNILIDAVCVFMRILLKIIHKAKPKYLAVVYDSKWPTFRHLLYPFYKANRPPIDPLLRIHLSLVRWVIANLELPVVEISGFEADDLVATLTCQAQDAGFYVVIVSGDKDFFQLLNSRVAMWDILKESWLSHNEIRKKLGIRPQLVIDYMSLIGDVSDNILGVPGIGPKIAVKLLTAYEKLDSILEKANTFKNSRIRNNLLNNRELVLLNRQLILLRKDVPISFNHDIFRIHELKFFTNIRLKMDSFLDTFIV